MSDLAAEHGQLLQFLYASPVGLVHAAPDGSIDTINGAAARFLLPLAPDGQLANLFTVLQTALPQLRAMVAAATSGTVLDGQHLAITPPPGSQAPTLTLSLTVNRLAGGRLVAVLSDITAQLRQAQVLAERDAHYGAVVAVLSEAILVHSPQGELLLCNAAAERLAAGTGDAAWQSFSPTPPGGRTLHADGSPMAAADTPTGRVLAGAPAQQQVLLLSVAPDGERRWFEVSAQPVHDPASDALLAVVTSFTDTTQRQRLLEELALHRDQLEAMVARRTQELARSNASLAEQQALLRTVADSVPGLVGYWDTDLRCRFANAAHADWFGRRPDDLPGLPLPGLLGPEALAQLQPHIDGALQGLAQHFQCTLRRADGALRHVLGVCVPHADGSQVRGFNMVVSDITELKVAELQLSAANQALARRAEQADDASQAKTAFLANMSHEIRTPMNAILGLTHLLARDAHDPQQQERLGKVDHAARHLLQVINDILDLSKINAGKMVLQDTPFDLDEVLARAVDLLANEARDKGLALQLDATGMPRWLRGDPMRLSQSLINLLGNAVRFTEHGWVRLQVQQLADDGPRVLLRFEVQDTGPGIAPEQQARLFHAFEQADSAANRRHGGTGLGLALTRHIAETMGGSVGLDSRPGSGSSFWFSGWFSRAAPVDLPEPQGSGLQAEQRLRQLHAGRRLLLVEDNAVNREVGLALLQAVGMQVDTADDGDAAVAMVLAQPYDLVLMDVQMPGTDGLAATRQIRTRGGGRSGPRLPILAMTANAFVDDRAACLAAGMNDHVPKPVDPAQLYETLLRWLPVAAAAVPPAAADAVRLPPGLAGLAGFDMASALQHLGGNAALLLRVLARFADSHRHGHPALRAAASADALPAWRAACHSLRGAAATVGVSGMLSLLAPFEQALKAQPADLALLQQQAGALNAQLAGAADRLAEALAG